MVAVPAPSPSPSPPVAMFSVALAGERRIGRYTNRQGILLVGEGDFSFSNCLANAFASAVNIVATSLDSREKLLKSYDLARLTLSNLERLGAVVLHGVDATSMASFGQISSLSFDRVIYNFPHAGFFGSEDNKKVIRRHKVLVRGFFFNALKLLRRNGEVHVSHKTTEPYTQWKLEKQAAKSGLLLRDKCKFESSDYPGYVNRRGAGADIGNTFLLGECETFMFIINPFWEKPDRCLPLPLASGVFAPRRMMVPLLCAMPFTRVFHSPPPPPPPQLLLPHEYFSPLRFEEENPMELKFRQSNKKRRRGDVGSPDVKVAPGKKRRRFGVSANFAVRNPSPPNFHMLPPPRMLIFPPKPAQGWSVTPFSQ